MTKKNCTPKKGRIIQIDEEGVRKHLKEIVKGTVQETLNTLLDEEADRLCNAKRYERVKQEDTGELVITQGHCIRMQEKWR